MDTDLLLTVGIVLAILTLPALLAAWSEGRAPRLAAIILLAAMVLVVTALTQKPGGYAFAEIPKVMLAVAGRYVP
jgi:hypothetical protein